MIQMYGWANIRESYLEDYEEENMPAINNNLRNKIADFSWHNGMISLKYLNGDLILTFALSINRMRQETYEAFDLYNYIAEIAKGSYGLIYLHDDENPEKYNQFQVYILARGQMRLSEDPFLSPLIPTVEDGTIYNGNNKSGKFS